MIEPCPLCVQGCQSDPFVVVEILGKRHRHNLLTHATTTPNHSNMRGTRRKASPSQLNGKHHRGTLENVAHVHDVQITKCIARLMVTSTGAKNSASSETAPTVSVSELGNLCKRTLVIVGFQKCLTESKTSGPPSVGHAKIDVTPAAPERLACLVRPHRSLECPTTSVVALQDRSKS